MIPAHRRFLAVDQGIIAALIDAVINDGFVWLFFRSMAVVPVSGNPSIDGDLAITAFLLPFFTVLITTPLVRAQVRGGVLPPPDSPLADYPILRLLPRGLFWRATVIGIVLLVTIGPLSIFGLAVLGVTGLSFRRFLVFKAIWSGIFGAAVTPLIALAALADCAAQPARPALAAAALSR